MAVDMKALRSIIWQEIAGQDCVWASMACSRPSRPCRCAGGRAAPLDGLSRMSHVARRTLNARSDFSFDRSRTQISSNHLPRYRRTILWKSGPVILAAGWSEMCGRSCAALELARRRWHGGQASGAANALPSLRRRHGSHKIRRTGRPSSGGSKAGTEPPLRSNRDRDKPARR